MAAISSVFVSVCFINGLGSSLGVAEDVVEGLVLTNHLTSDWKATDRNMLGVARFNRNLRNTKL